MYLMPVVLHSSAYCTIASGSFGAMITSASGATPGSPRNDSSAALAIAPV